MFRKTRKQIILSVMTALLVLLAVIMSAIWISEYLSLKKQNEEMLDRYVAMYSLDSLPGEGLPELPADSAAVPPELPEGDLFQLSSFYSAAIADDGSVLACDTGRTGLYRTEDIVSRAEEILAGEAGSGVLDHLIFRIDKREGYTLVAFIDTTLTENSLNRLILNMLAAGLISMAVLFAAAVFIAGRIVQPLEENDRRQKQFISDAEHELKTPVSVISANAELLSREIGENRWLANISYENERMGNLIKGLLELSHAELAPADSEVFDFSKLTEQEILPFESVAFEHRLTLRSEIEKHITVKGSRHLLAQLIGILLDNAISHAEGSGDISVKLKREHHQALLLVTNPGEAISDEVKDHLFDRFYRRDTARGGEEGHFGLGLPIAKAIADRHGGTIAIRCQDGKVIFSVTLPAEQ